MTLGMAGAALLSNLALPAGPFGCKAAVAAERVLELPVPHLAGSTPPFLLGTPLPAGLSARPLSALLCPAGHWRRLAIPGPKVDITRLGR